MTTASTAQDPGGLDEHHAEGDEGAAGLRALLRAALTARAGQGPPDPHPRSLGLCLVEAVQAPRLPVAVTAAVVGRYRGLRRADGADPDTDGPGDVLAVLDELGEDGWVERVGTRHRAWPSTTAPLRAAATRTAARTLLDLGLVTTTDLLDLLEGARHHGQGRGGAATAWEGARSRWSAVPGQGSGLSWHWLHLLAGSRVVLPDVPARRAVALAERLPLRAVRGAAAAAAVETAAAALGTAPREVDHALWRAEARRRDRVSRSAAPP